MLGQARGEEARGLLEAAVYLGASKLTLLECERSLLRPDLAHAAAETARARLANLALRWDLFEIDAPVLARAGQPFPVEPVRALDAIHLATLVEIRREAGEIALLSTDDRISRNARALGFRVLP
jgi:predicted nucleic acid-binding protein